MQKHLFVVGGVSLVKVKEKEQNERSATSPIQFYTHDNTLHFEKQPSQLQINDNINDAWRLGLNQMTYLFCISNWSKENIIFHA